MLLVLFRLSDVALFAFFNGADQTTAYLFAFKCRIFLATKLTWLQLKEQLLLEGQFL